MNGVVIARGVASRDHRKSTYILRRLSCNPLHAVRRLPISWGRSKMRMTRTGGDKVRRPSSTSYVLLSAPSCSACYLPDIVRRVRRIIGIFNAASNTSYLCTQQRREYQAGATPKDRHAHTRACFFSRAYTVRCRGSCSLRSEFFSA